jgi:hypothetical protein
MRHSAGRRPLPSPEQKAELAQMVREGPDPAVDGVVRWHRIDLKRKIEARFGVVMHERTLSQTACGARVSPSLGAAPAPEIRPSGTGGVQKNVAATVKAALPEAAQGKPMEVWFQDEARVGQQGTLTRTWAERGTRPRAPRDTRYRSAYIFGAVCPGRGATAALIMPFANTEAMSAHLSEISKAVASGAHAILVMDGAGGHGANALCIPENISTVMLPPYAPELNPVENT